MTVAGAGAGVGSGSATVGIGGQGASAGHGGVVTLNVNNNVVTKGDDSRGVFSQSLGGGGGNGAFNVSVVGSGAGVGSGVANISLGGSAGTAGDGKSVTSNVIGDITTNGKNSAGVQAQSLGGGGGDGGFSVNISGTGAGAGSSGLMVGLGGNVVWWPISSSDFELLGYSSNHKITQLVFLHNHWEVVAEMEDLMSRLRIRSRNRIR